MVFCGIDMQMMVDIWLQAHPDLIQAFQAAAAGSAGSSTTTVNKSLNAAVVGDTLPRGRGVDERAARAAAEVRKKAAARGLLIPPHGVPVQALPPLSQLLNIINSSVTPEAAAVSEGVKDTNSDPSNGSIDAKKDRPPSVQNDQVPPAGLGKGLASLDAKKKKSKSKISA